MISIGVVGDFNPSFDTHVSTNEALRHAAPAVGHTVDVSWIPTEELEGAQAERLLERFHGIWAAAGSPYKSMAGALNAIRFARERKWPFFGT